MSGEVEALYMRLRNFSPKTEMQRTLHTRALQVTNELAQARLLLFTQKNNSISMPFLGVLVFWLTIIFASFSLFARPSPIVVGALVVFAASATGAIYLILELNEPFTGLLQISSEPLIRALGPLGR